MRTVNGPTELTFKIIPQGLYVLEESFEYADLNKLLDEGHLVPVGWEREVPVETTITGDVIPIQEIKEEVEKVPNIESDSVEVTDSDLEDPEISKFICDICGAECATSRALSRHKTTKHPESV